MSKPINPECKRLLDDLTAIAKQSHQETIVVQNGSLCIGVRRLPGDPYTTSYIFHPGDPVRCEKCYTPIHNPGRSQSSPHQVYHLLLTIEGLRRAWAIVQRRLQRSNHHAHV